MFKTFIGLIFAVFCGLSMSDEPRLTIAAASDLRFALPELIAIFVEKKDETVDVVYGSSGRFYAQIRNGAPFDVYFSADIAYPKDLVERGFVVGPVIPYAVGRLVLWRKTLGGKVKAFTFDDLLRPDITHIAIANPRHAPYGQRAEEALRAAGVWEQVESKLVIGENVAQAAQYVDSGAAQVGIIALSLALAPSMADKGAYSIIPDSQHELLEQGLVLTKSGAVKPAARRFVEFLSSIEARAVLRRHGFLLPGE